MILITDETLKFIKMWGKNNILYSKTMAVLKFFFINGGYSEIKERLSVDDTLTVGVSFSPQLLSANPEFIKDLKVYKIRIGETNSGKINYRIKTNNIMLESDTVSRVAQLEKECCTPAGEKYAFTIFRTTYSSEAILKAAKEKGVEVDNATTSDTIDWAVIENPDVVKTLGNTAHDLVNEFGYLPLHALLGDVETIQ